MKHARAVRLAGGVALSVVVSFGCGAVAPASSEGDDSIESVSSPIVVKTGDSPASENFIVYITRRRDPEQPTKVHNCSGVLVAANLVLTAKHCLYEYEPSIVSTSYCDVSSGEPLGATTTGGFVTGTIPVNDLEVYAGIDGRKRAELKLSEPSAAGWQIIDDGSTALCSHDLGYLVLDRPIVDAPIARLRLGQRPQDGLRDLVLAGWGRTEKTPPGTGQMVLNRIYRAGISIQSVGPAEPPNPSGSVAPRTFHTGPAGCIGDSGGALFDPAKNNAVLGILVRAANTVPDDEVSPCAPDQVINVYTAVTDFPDHLRRAFKTVNAQPWLEGHDAPGFLQFGEPCLSGLECAGMRCVGATATSPGTCNVDCSRPEQTCPAGYVCGAAAVCEPPSAAPTTPPPLPSAADPSEDEGVVGASGSSCSTVPSPRSPTRSHWIVMAFAACAALRRRIGVDAQDRRFRM